MNLCCCIFLSRCPQAGEFCSEFQLVVSSDKVEFVRMALPDPAEALQKRRSPHLVDSKNTKSLGEYVNGGPLPPRPIHTPYSSFSPGARLLSREPSPFAQAPPTQTQQPVYSIVDMATAVNEIVNEVARNDLIEIVWKSIREVGVIKPCFICESFTHTILHFMYPKAS